MRAILVRLKNLSNYKQTCGRFILLNEDGDMVFQAASLELPWNANMRSVSCIPTGSYSVTKVNSPKFGTGTFIINNVPNRSSILIHPGNFTRQIEGCILLGSNFNDIDCDGITDVVNSKVAVEKLKSLASSFELTVMQI